MNEWLLSIISISLIASLISFVLPEGKLNKNIKSFFKLGVFVLILQPFFNINILKDTFYLNDFEDYSYQENYVFFIQEQKIVQMEKNCLTFLEENGVKKANCNIEYIVIKNGQLEIKKVIIDLKNAVINFDKEHIDNIEEIRLYLAKRFQLEINQVIVNE